MCVCMYACMYVGRAVHVAAMECNINSTVQQYVHGLPARVQ